MSGEEQALVDTRGKFVQVVRDGRKVADLEWLDGRIILSNRRLVLVAGDGKRTLALSRVGGVTNRRHADSEMAPGTGYFSVQVGAAVYLVAPAALDEFEEHLYGALLDSEVVFVKHPALEGDVVQDVEWRRGRVSTAATEVGFALETGEFVGVPVDDVGGVDVRKRVVRGTDRRVLEIEHAVGGTSVETHVTGLARDVSILESLAGKATPTGGDDVDLSDRERQVLMALYSGVSPFEVPDFVGMDVEAVEAVFDQLVEVGALTETRVRRDVRLKARGRAVANEAMSEN